MRWRSSSSSHLRLSLLSIFFFLSLTWLSSPSLAIAVAVSDQFDGPNTTESSNVSRSRPREDSFAGIIDRALEKEFTESDQTEANDAGSFNNSVAEQQAVLETVARVKSKKNDTKEEKPFQLHHVFNLDNDHRGEDTPTLIDRKDNVFIISNFKSKYPVLQLDLRLISDLVVVIVSATCGGIAFACAGQPVITGYLLAGSAVGPGGLSFVSEMVQVETVAQFGVIFLLFALGLEFSTTKLRVVRAVAILGGLLQIFLFMCLCGVIASLCGGKLSEGVFVGTFLSMSSTAVVLKFLMEKNSTNALHGQVTIGTLILQDCAVGLLFALLPVLGGTSGVLQGIISMTKSLVVLILFLAVLSILSRTCVPWFLKLMISLSSQTNELYQLAAVAFCLLVAWCSDKLGLSLELGSFAAGVMISTTDLAQHTLEQVEPIRNFFAALFLASIGMLIHVHFLWNHVDILLASVLLVIIVKTIVITIVVKGFSYNYKTSLLVGMSLAQIGEFAFVLLSRASNLHLVEGKLYLLLLGTTALSLVTTPLLFKLIPAVVHLGVLLRWFSPDSPSEVLISKQSHLGFETAMQGYDRDDYEDLDEYEEDGEEQEEDGIGEGEYEEEEAPQTTQEELEYLELRQRLKEAIRKQIKKESGSGHANSQEKKKKLPYDNYGSFFGPSQPVIAQRVIQESKSLLENHHLAPKVSKSNHDVGTIKSKSLASTTAGSKTQARNHHPKVVNQLKTKVQKLKDTRDYSFLLSDDAELPAPTKDPPIRNVSVPNSEARSVQVPPKSRQWSTNTGRLVPNSREERKPMSTGSQTHPKTGPHKLISAGKPIPTSVNSRKQLGNNNGSGPGRPLGPKGLPSKMPAATTERRVAAPQRQSLDQKPSVHRPPSSKLHSSAPKQASVPKQSLDQKKEVQGSSRGKMMPKQPVPSSKPQINKQPAKIPSCPPLREDRPKKKPVRPYDDDDVDDDDDEGGRAISMIRSMFRYNPRKFADEDDDSDMEANYEDIMREEQRSARIARKEDEEELRKIEEEERRERLRKEAKKRKLSQR